MKTKTLVKKLTLKKRTVSHLDMNEVKGGVVISPTMVKCPPTFSIDTCIPWTMYPCTYYYANCVTIPESAPCC
jgi:hypothetical protein